jgi:Cu(I)/Ag(I) efflux system membrane protein CusA/SilA
VLGRWMAWCARNRFFVFSGAVLLLLGGIWALGHLPLDALPDISDVQVVLRGSWPGEPPTIIEDQLTYPLVTALRAVPRVQQVRAQTMFGDAFIYVVFQDGTDLYWARSRVLEYLQQIQPRLPAGARVSLGPDATGAGWIYEYVVVDRSHRWNLADLRSLQDWFLRYQLETVPGVAEVASIGGFVRQYQVRLDPDRLRAYGIPLGVVVERVRNSVNEVGGGVLELAGAEYMIRGEGYLKSLDDLANVVVSSRGGVPVRVRDLGEVSFGPASRRGVAEWNGEGETVGGIVIMRVGENALRVIEGVKRKLAELQPSLPPGVAIETAYDRSELIRASIHVLQRDLWIEALVVSAVTLLFLFHVRSALVPLLSLPVAVIGTFLPLALLRVDVNIMSLGGLALAIGVLVDATLVLVENGCRRLAEKQQHGPLSEDERHTILVQACQQVGPALFVSLLIIVLSFLPVFLLEAQEGRLFRPLAWTKTLSVVLASLLAMTLAPPLLLLLIRGRVPPETATPLSRWAQAIYLPVLRWCLRHRRLTLLANLAILVATVPLAFHLGSQFMPPLYEGSVLYMPTALPGISIRQAGDLLQVQDRILRTFPEVESVFGTVGRSDSATDNAPLDMYDTTVVLKPPSLWRPGMTYERLVAEMDRRLQFPGLTNTWTMPIQNRLDMELTGLKTPLGIKVHGTDLRHVETVANQMEQLLSSLPGTQSVFAERVLQGYYANIVVDRIAAARYGLTVGDVQQAIEAGLGGAEVATNVEGRQRFAVQVRYQRDFRQNLPALAQLLIATPSGAQVPLAEVARIELAPGPAMLRDEDGLLTAYVYLQLSTTNIGGYVRQAETLLRQRLQIPAGVTWSWAGQWQYQQRARRRLELILPLVFFSIFALLFALFRSVLEALVLLLPSLYALSGGLLLQWWLGFRFSVAVWVGYIALFGIAVQTGVVMVVYLEEALRNRLHARGVLSRQDIEEATLEGAVLRLRPKLMTVATVLGSLIPILVETGVGSDVMKPIAAPIVGGMITSLLHVLIVVPVIFAWTRERMLLQGPAR